MGDRAQRPSLLFVTHRVPYPPDKGERIRDYHLLRFISQRARIHLATLADEPVDSSHLAELNRYCERICIVPLGRWSRWLRAASSLGLGRSATEGAFFSGTLAKTIRSWAQTTKYHAALASSSGVARYFELPELSDVPQVVDLIDLDSQKWFDYAGQSKGVKRWLYRLEGKRLRRVERTLAVTSHALTLVSEAEVQLYREHCGGGPLSAVENGVDLDYFQAAPDVHSPTCVFVGALDYRPNIDGAIWFCHEVWPALREARPGAQFSLVGRKPGPPIKRLEQIPGVRVIGQVPDVRPHLAAASVVVVPLRIARGIQNKVLEALAMAKPTVASPQALEGLEVVPGQEALAAGSPEQWMRAIRLLWDRPQERQRIGAAGRKFVEEVHCWDSCLLPFERILSLQPAQSAQSLGESQCKTPEQMSMRLSTNT